MLAFFFARDTSAQAAVAALADEGRVNGSIETAPLSVEGIDGSILALTADDDAHDAIVDICARLEGRVVADVPEEWTRPRGERRIGG